MVTDFAQGSHRSIRQSMRASRLSVYQVGDLKSAFGGLIVLKIVIVDILITGLGDAITDIAQVPYIRYHRHHLGLQSVPSGPPRECG